MSTTKKHMMKCAKKAWEDNYALAREYSLPHGDLNIPNDYIASNGVWLGKWVSAQRKAKETHHLTKNQITKLNAIAICREDKQNTHWNKSFAALSGYIQKANDPRIAPSALNAVSGFIL